MINQPSRAIAQILNNAIALRASDIHFEPYDKVVRLRLRVDGLLHEQSGIPREHYAALKACLKTMAGLDTTQTFTPQDGRIDFAGEQNAHAFRIHCCPSLFDEKMVLRHQETANSILPLSQLGLLPAQLEGLQTVLNKTHGLMMVTGPTGSGKTMTLYACLQALKSRNLQITSLEEPVEVPLPHVTQIPIRPDRKFDYPTALKAVLRQDPDVIMIGEIRDAHTAEIAVRAALTGHLVITTLHTPNAWATLTRLKNLNIAGFHLADSLQCIVAQRLVRRLSDPRSEQYHGRVGVFECCFPHAPFKEALCRDQLNRSMLPDYISLQEAGRQHIAAGLTTESELLRVL